MLSAEFLAGMALAKPNWHSPSLSQSVKREAQVILTAETPARPEEIGKTVLRLLLMYDSFDRRAEASKTAVIDQWRKSLRGYPADVLAQATQEWIDGPKAAFVPQPGDIITICDRIGAYRRRLADRAKLILPNGVAA